MKTSDGQGKLHLTCCANRDGMATVTCPNRLTVPDTPAGLAQANAAGWTESAHWQYCPTHAAKWHHRVCPEWTPPWTGGTYDGITMSHTGTPGLWLICGICGHETGIPLAAVRNTARENSLQSLTEQAIRDGWQINHQEARCPPCAESLFAMEAS